MHLKEEANTTDLAIYCDYDVILTRFNANLICKVNIIIRIFPKFNL